MNRERKNQIKKVGDALILAMGHLHYCNYGNRWERECAVYHEIPKTLKDAVRVYKEIALDLDIETANDDE